MKNRNTLLIFVTTAILTACSQQASIPKAGLVIADSTIKESEPKIDLEKANTVIKKSYFGDQDIIVSSFNRNDLLIDGDEIVSYNNKFIGMIGLAFANHYALEISPDDIWLLILQGFYQHIKANRDSFKNQFYSDPSDSTVEIRDDGLSLKSSRQDWENDILLIEDSLQKKIPKQTFKQFQSGFSTTSRNDSMVFKATFLSVANLYYEITIVTLCGLPRIRILGNQNDWIKLKSQFDDLSISLKAEFWKDQLDPVLDKFIRAFDGNVNHDEWRKFYKDIKPNQSGDVPGINGWIKAFIPYTKDGARINWEGPIYLNSIPSGISICKVKWKVQNEQYNLGLISGFIGVTLTSDGFLSSSRNWMIVKFDK